MNALTQHIVERFSSEANGAPLHVALSQAIASAVDDRSLRPGDSLPSERVLCELLGLSRVTVRHSIGDLVESGLLVRRHGARTVVAGRVQKLLSGLSSFSEDIRSRDMVPGVRWISKEIVRPTPAEVMALMLSPQDSVIRMRRIRLADGRPIAIERCTIPQKFLENADFKEDSLYVALDRKGARPTRGTQRIRAGSMTAEEAKMLEARPGAALLLIERRCFLDDGRAVEFTETRYHADHYDFVTELGLMK